MATQNVRAPTTRAPIGRRTLLETHRAPVLPCRRRPTRSREERRMTIQWTPDLSVGIAEIDAQHLELFRRAGRLLAAMAPGAAEEARPLIEALQACAVEHFCLEEAFMSDARFPGYVRHKAEHDRFIEDLHAIAREHEVRGRGAFDSLRAAQWLKGWLREHLSGTDVEMGRYLAERSA
jgi:hemerythrin